MDYHRDMRPTARARASRPELFLLLTASAGCAMTVLDANIVAVVLPGIARDLGASFADIEWVVSAYVLCFASLLLPAGAIADRFGRRRVFLFGVAGFAASSLLCGIAPSAPLLYLARALQGGAAAFLLASALAIIAHGFHEEAARNRAWALWGAIMGLTMVLAPITGGLIAYLLGWRWAFYINVPICIALGGAVRRYVPESRDEAARSLDPGGILSFAVAMFALTWGLISGPAHGWGSARCLAGLIGGAVALAAFIAIERAQDRPMLDLRLFANRRLIGAVWAMFAYAACAQVMATLLPPFLQNGLGLTAIRAGFAMSPFAFAMLIFPQIGRLLSRSMTSAGILATGLALTGLGNALTAWGALSGSWPLILTGMAVLGSGGGLLNGETQKAIMNNLPHNRAGMASGISTTARFSGILLGFALLSSVLASAARSAIQTGSAAPASLRDLADAVVAGNVDALVSGLSAPAAQAALATAHRAYSWGFSIALTSAAAMAWLSSLCVFALIAGRRRSP